MFTKKLSKQIASLLNPPALEGTENAHVSGLLQIMLLVIFIAAAGLPIAGFINDPSFDAGRLVSIILALFILFLIIRVHKGHITFASILLPVLIFLAVSATVIGESGLRDPDISGYFLLIAVASMLLGARGTLIFGGLSMISALIAYFVEVNQIMAIPPLGPPNPTSLLTLLTTIGLMTVLLRFAVQRINEGFEQARLHAESLAQSNQQLEAMRDSLALRVEERTQELSATLDNLQEAQAELMQAKEAAEKANLAKSAFLSSMSHELRTPLNGILGFTQILAQDSTLSFDQDEGLDVIKRSGEHLLRLIEDLLDISKIETGKIEIFSFELYLPSLLQEVVAVVRLQAERKGLSFYFESDPDLPKSVTTDEKRLRQILLNLLNNAVKFTHQGNVTLRVFRVKDEHIPPDKVKVCFEVSDTGVGVPEEHLEEIFLPFSQVGDSQSQAEGVGLGLAICAQLAEIMGGQIHVESTVGVGSRFKLNMIFPLIEEPSTDEADKELPVVGFQGPQLTILIVDDNSFNRLLLTSLLKPLNFNIVEAENGQEAIDFAQKIQPDVILIDAVMPVLSGAEAIQQIPQIPALRDVLIITISANVYDENRSHSLASGSDAFLPKPVEVKKLLALIESHSPIKWIHGETGDNEPQVMILPDNIILSEFYDLAMMGDLLNIKRKMKSLVKVEPKFLPFNQELQKLIDQFDDEGTVKFLEKHINSLSEEEAV